MRSRCARAARRPPARVLRGTQGYSGVTQGYSGVLRGYSGVLRGTQGYSGVTQGYRTERACEVGVRELRTAAEEMPHVGGLNREAELRTGRHGMTALLISALQGEAIPFTFARENRLCIARGWTVVSFA